MATGFGMGPIGATGTGFGSNIVTGMGGFGTSGSAGGTGAFGSAGSFGSGVGQSTPIRFGTSGTGFGGSLLQKKEWEAVLDPDPVGREILRRLHQLQCAYLRSHEGYRFCFIFYNERDKTIAPSPRPSNISEAEWVRVNMECPDPDHLVPCPVMGFEAVHQRHEEQLDVVYEMQKRLEGIQSRLGVMATFYGTKLHGGFEKARQNSSKVIEELNTVYEIDAVQRHQGSKLTEPEDKLLRDLEKINREIQEPGNYNALIKKLRKKWAKKPYREDTVRAALLDESLEGICRGLDQNQKALEALERTATNLGRLADEWVRNLAKEGLSWTEHA
jgi:hypothetical protein